MSIIINQQFGQNIGKTAVTTTATGDFNISGLSPNTSVISWEGTSDGSLLGITGALPFHSLMVINNSPNLNSALTIANGSSIAITSVSTAFSQVGSILLAKGEAVNLIFVGNAWRVEGNPYVRNLFAHPYVSGSGHCPWSLGTQSKATASFPVGNLTFFPFYTADPLYCRNFTMEATTAGSAGSFMHVRIFADNSAFANDNTSVRTGVFLTKTNEIDIATTGVKTSTFATPVVLPRGMYWCGIAHSSTSIPSLRTLSSSEVPSPVITGTSSNTMTQVAITYNFANDSLGVGSTSSFNSAITGKPIFLFRP